MSTASFITEQDHQLAVVECQKYLASSLPKMKTRLIFVMITGSYAYHLDVESSDKDYLGVFVCESADVLRYDPIIPQKTLATKPGERDLPDFSLYEVRTFIRHLLEGNPFALQVMYSKPSFSTPEWDELLQLSRLTLTRNAVDQLISYVQGQLNEHKAQPKVGKRIYHTLRLLYEAKRITQGQEPQIFLLEGPERDRLMAIKMKHEVDESVALEAETLIDELEACKPWTAIPAVGILLGTQLTPGCPVRAI